MSEKVNILGVKVDKHTIETASDKIVEFVKEDALAKTVFTPNSEIIMMAYRDKEFCTLLNSSDILTADGIGVVYASKIVKNPISERAAGYDVACRTLEKLSSQNATLYLFGAKPGVAETAKDNIENKYKGIRVVGTSDGYFDKEKEKEIIKKINDAKPDILFVCLGAPKQEKWISEHKHELGVKVCMGIGGSLDVFAGTVKRAPEFYTRHGIEWLYRLLKQPSRFVRMLDLPRFGFKVLIAGRKFPQE